MTAFCAIVALLVSAGASQARTPAPATSTLVWKQLPPLPAATGEKALGVAGAFSGVSNDALLVAGGANFPHGYPWETRPDGSAPPKVYYRVIHVLAGPEGQEKWRRVTTQLPTLLGYGVSVTTTQGVLCAGGEWKDPPDADGQQTLHRSDKVFLLRWDPERREVALDGSFPPLPTPATAQCGAVVGNSLYLACGDTGTGPSNVLWALDLSKREGWEVLPPCPGLPRVLAVAAAQHTAEEDCLFVFSGRRPRQGATDYLTDAWSFSPSARTWKRVAGVAVDGAARCVMGGTAVPWGANHLLLFGGAEGKLFQLLAHDLPVQLAAAEAAGDADAVDRLNQRKLNLLTHHPGFSRDVLAYHTLTDTWTQVGAIQGASPVTTTAVTWRDGIVLPSGEISPGIRTPQVIKATPHPRRQFGLLNYVVLFLYLLLIVGNGLFFSRKMKTTDDFFKAGGRIPWWAAGLSIFGTQLSAITFIAIPASSFATDWRRFIGYVGILAVAPLVVHLFLPFYRRLSVTTAYEYLELRFNLVVRLAASVMFILLQFGRIAIVLLLPSMALSVTTGMSVDLCILLMGVLCIVYTALGGMEAVVWTDVTQVCILAGGALLSLLLIPSVIDGGWNGMIDLAEAAGKFRLLDFHFEFTETAFFVVLFGSFGQNLISYGTDQSVIQRYLTTPDEQSAARSIWLNAVLSLPAGMIFLGIGSALFAFYRTHPASLDFTLAKNDALFPLFIVTQLPAGVAGLVIAGVFAASMSSLDSSMNSVAAAVTTDFYQRFRPGSSSASSLTLARAATAVVGVLGTALAVVMAHSEVKSLWDAFAGLVGLFGGGLGGLFLLAILSRRTHGIGAILGLVGSGLVQFLVKNYTHLNPWFYAFTGIASCMVLGYLTSVLVPGRPKTEGLTLHSLTGMNDTT